MKLLFLLLIPSLCLSQPKGAKTIIVKGVGFFEICNALLDSGYVIEKKDNELQTAVTELRVYPRYFNAYYKINIRVKDSTAYISGSFTGPGKTGGLFKDEPIENMINKKGKVLKTSISGYPFSLLYEFAASFKKEIDFK